MPLMVSADGGKKKEWTLGRINEMYVSLFPDDPVEIGKNILWIDRNTQGRAAIVAHLGRRGFNFKVVDSPLACLQQIDNERVDAIIVEIDLKPLSGIDLLEIIRKDPNHRHLPVIIISGHDPVKFKHERALVKILGGVNAKMLAKPISSMPLMNALTQIFTRHPLTSASKSSHETERKRPQPAPAPTNTIANRRVSLRPLR